MSLDVDLMRRLYKSGKLIAYRVVYFDKLQFQVRDYHTTFNEDVAIEKMKGLMASGFPAEIKQFFVKFDGAFSQKTGTPIQQQDARARKSI